MDKGDLEKKWDELVKQTFDQFINEYIGRKEEQEPPKCYGSGNNQVFCQYCEWKPTC